MIAVTPDTIDLIEHLSKKDLKLTAYLGTTRKAFFIYDLRHIDDSEVVWMEDLIKRTWPESMHSSMLVFLGDHRNT